jgi:hypothetical protein
MAKLRGTCDNQNPEYDNCGMKGMMPGERRECGYGLGHGTCPLVCVPKR